MLEDNVVSAILADRAAYDALAGVLDASEFSEWGRLVVRAVGGYYEADPAADCVDGELLRSALARTIPNPKHLDSCLRYVAELPPHASGPNVARE